MAIAIDDGMVDGFSDLGRVSAAHRGLVQWWEGAAS
jgi:hypothetical protein